MRSTTRALPSEACRKGSTGLWGVGLLLLLLEAARRALGWALPVIAAVFVTVCFFGPELPAFMAFRRVSLDRMVSQLTMSSEGVYGLPLGVSASTVFLFVLLGSMLEKSGGGRYFVNLAFSLLGGYRGGPAKAAVLSSGLTGLVSGSSNRQHGNHGDLHHPVDEARGLSGGEGGGRGGGGEHEWTVDAADHGGGGLHHWPPRRAWSIWPWSEPPSCRAIVSYLALIYITHLEACKLGLRGVPREELPRFWSTFASGLHFLLPLGLLVVLLVRRFSAEMAAFWGIALLAGLVLRPGRRLRRSVRGVA